MSRKKNINNYYKEQEKLRKKQKQDKITSTLLNVLIVVLSIALVVTAGYMIFQPEPFDPVKDGEKVKVAMEVKDYGTIILEVYPDLAPITVENFLNYVNEGFYDGLTFHRVIENFMIQGGDPKGDGTGLSTLQGIKGEFSNNGVKNDLKFNRGVVGMARSDDNDSATSQFFICHKQSSHLDGEYAAFGVVIDGMEVVDAIATCEKSDEKDTSGNKYKPEPKIYIEKMYVVE